MAEFPCGTSSSTSSLGSAACWFGLEMTEFFFILAENILREFLQTASIGSPGGNFCKHGMDYRICIYKEEYAPTSSAFDPCISSALGAFSGNNRQAAKGENNVSEIHYTEYHIYDADIDTPMPTLWFLHGTSTTSCCRVETRSQSTQHVSLSL